MKSSANSSPVSGGLPPDALPTLTRNLQLGARSLRLPRHMGLNGALRLASRPACAGSQQSSGQWQNRIGLQHFPAKHPQLKSSRSDNDNLTLVEPISTPHPTQNPHTNTMPRQSRSTARPAPARPTVPARAAPAPTQQQQTRPATTYAAPPSAAPQAPTAPVSQGPGLLGQMASTAAYAHLSPDPNPTQTLVWGNRKKFGK
jgi:hypothetical protein